MACFRAVILDPIGKRRAGFPAMHNYPEYGGHYIVEIMTTAQVVQCSSFRVANVTGRSARKQEQCMRQPRFCQRFNNAWATILYWAISIAENSSWHFYKEFITAI